MRSLAAWLLLIAMFVAGCRGEPVATSLPTSVLKVTPVPSPTRSVVQQEAEIRAGIIDVYGSEPRPTWYKDLHLVSGEIDLALDGTSLFVGATSAARADEMCRDIAFIPFDSEGVLIGFRHVHIQVGPDLVADCDIRD